MSRDYFRNFAANAVATGLCAGAQHGQADRPAEAHGERSERRVPALAARGATA